jgi:hypothetical protein
MRMQQQGQHCQQHGNGHQGIAHKGTLLNVSFADAWCQSSADTAHNIMMASPGGQQVAQPACLDSCVISI